MERKLRLVLVDDHQMIRETWRMLLSRDPRIEVIGECASGAEAVQRAAEWQPDVMLMDINMEPVNGFQATEQICRAQPGIKVIGMSVNDQPSYARHMLQAGARGFVTKNSSLAEMIEAIFEVSRGNTFICAEVRARMQD